MIRAFKTAPAERSPARRARVALLLTAAITAVLYAVPQAQIIAYPFVLIGTLAHEMGHGIAAVLAGGEFHSLAIYADGSGVAGWGQSAGEVGRLGRAFVAAGGLIGPALAAAILFPVARRPARARWALGAIGLALVVALVLVVRNGLGVAFVGVLAAVCLVLAFKASADVAQIAVIFLAVQLSLSAFARADYLFTDTAHTAEGAQPSDVAQMADALLLPYWLWGALCGLLSVAVLAAGAWAMIRKGRAETRLRAPTPTPAG